MSYGQIVTALTRSLGTQILGYDNMPDHGGCILYVRGPTKRIDITAQAMGLGTDELAAFIRQTLTNPPPPNSSLRVGIRDGALAVL